MYGVSGNGIFLPAAILNFINLQGTLAPHCTYQECVAVWFEGEMPVHARTHARGLTATSVCIPVCVRTHIYIYMYKTLSSFLWKQWNRLVSHVCENSQ